MPLVTAGAGEAARTVRNTNQRPQQGELVRRRFLVVEHDVPEQRECAGPVVGEPEPDDLPPDLRSSGGVRNPCTANRLKAMAPRQLLDLGGRGGFHRTIERQGSLAETEHHARARTHHRDQLAERTGTHAAWHVHPHRAHPDQVEGELRTQHLLQRWQGVVHPPDVGRSVAILPGRTELRGRFHRDHVVPVRRKPRGVSSGARAHVEDAAGGVGEKIEHRGVNLLEREALVLGHERRCSHVVARYDVAHSEGALAVTGTR